MSTQQMLLTGQAVWLLSSSAIDIAVSMSWRQIMSISGFCLRDMFVSRYCEWQLLDGGCSIKRKLNRCTIDQCQVRGHCKLSQDGQISAQSMSCPPF